MAVTAEQEALIDAIRRVLEADPDVQALWLAGSLGRGGGDAFSDVDTLVLAADGKLGAVMGRYAADISPIAAPALVNPLYGGRVLNVVDVDWRRFDLTFVEAGDLVRYDAAALTMLFNKGERSPPTRVPTPYRTQPAQLLSLVNEFYRVLGLLAVGAGREEWLLGLTGVDILRKLTIDLMLEENGVGPAERGGALHRNPLLIAEQRAALEALAPVAASRASLLAANLALAAIFLPRARRLAAATGTTWPDTFEAATRRHLKARLGMELD
jgi:predicted nucleotidyltransferase